MLEPLRARRFALPRRAAVVVAAAVTSIALVGCSAESETTASDPAPAASAEVEVESGSESGGESGAEESTPAQDVEEGGEIAAEEPAPGQRIGYDEWSADPAAYSGSDVVLYFHADWCHLCQETDEALAATGVPAGLTLVEVDYDTRTDLRQEYGVTVQHSFVKVDDSGSRVDVWTGTTTGEAIAERAA